MFKKLLISAIIVLIMGSCTTYDTFTYYYSKDKSKVVTEMILDGKVYMIDHYYNIKKVPLEYVSPLSGLDNYWYCYIYWEGEKTCIIAGYGEWEEVGVKNNFYFERIRDNLKFNEFTRLYKDRYIVLGGDINN